jgi:hypothetical protein
MKDDFRYNASYCFETFPFPSEWESDAALDDAGRAYHEYRAQLMVANDEGLTATYNRFHSPDEDSPGILELRRLHDAMDRAVLVAYGWTDLAPTCEFLLEYEASEEEGGGRKKKPWRYRWPDALRDEVLARLLALNGKRAAEERAAAEAKAKAEAKAAGEAKAKAKADRVQGKVVEAVEATEKPKRPKRGAKAAPEGGGTPVPKE